MTQKKAITKEIIARVYYQTIDTQPFYETRGSSHSERIIDWFELEGYNITPTAIKNIFQYIKVRKQIAEQVLFSLNK
jgi:hypothetical protein